MRATTDQEGILQDILANPGDDVPRLVYADYLEDEWKSEQAEFIRVQIELARTGQKDCQQKEQRKHGWRGGDDWVLSEVRCGTCDFCRLMRRSEQLLQANDYEIAKRPLGIGSYAFSLEHPDLAGYKAWTSPTLFYRRGFIRAMWASEEYFCEKGWRVLASQPVEEIRLGDKKSQFQFLRWRFLRQTKAKGYGDTPWILSHGIFDCLTGGSKDSWGCTRSRVYRAESESLRALSAACLLFARRKIRKAKR